MVDIITEEEYAEASIYTLIICEVINLDNNKHGWMWSVRHNNPPRQNSSVYTIKENAVSDGKLALTRIVKELDDKMAEQRELLKNMEFTVHTTTGTMKIVATSQQEANKIAEQDGHRLTLTNG
jgi:hypothetical protein